MEWWSDDGMDAIQGTFYKLENMVHGKNGNPIGSSKIETEKENETMEIVYGSILW